MSIQNVIERHYKQDCVYWGSPVKDGQGGFTYAAPVELKCRWEEMRQLVTDSKGVEFTSRALIFVKQDVDEEGVLFLGTLEDLYDQAESSATAVSDPKDFNNTFHIRRFQKIPALGSTTEFIRKAYLTPSLSFGGF